MAYLGAPIFLDSLLVAPKASLMVQSLAAREAKTVVNADGCGIGWYGERAEPGVYHGVLPAWSDHNLASLCRQLRSRMFVAHVRSATSGEVASEPFDDDPGWMKVPASTVLTLDRTAEPVARPFVVAGEAAFGVVHIMPAAARSLPSVKRA